MAARPNDFLYGNLKIDSRRSLSSSNWNFCTDPLFTVSSKNDFLKVALKAESLQETCNYVPIFDNMFSEINKYPNKELMIYKEHYFMESAEILWSKKQNGAKKNGVPGEPENLQTRLQNFLDVIPRVRVGEAGVFRVTGNRDQRHFLKASINLPAGLNEVALIEKFRYRRLWEKVFDSLPMTSAYQKTRYNMINELESMEWKFREKQIHDYEKMRLELLECLIRKTEEELRKVSKSKMEAFIEKKTLKKQKNIEQIRRQCDKDLNAKKVKKITFVQKREKHKEPEPEVKPVSDPEGNNDEISDVLEDYEDCKELACKLTKASIFINQRKASIILDEKRIKDHKDEKIYEALTQLQSSITGSILDFLNKELKRLIDERKAHAFFLLAENERLQNQQCLDMFDTTCKESDDIYKMFTKTCQEVSDVYLQDIVATSIESNQFSEKKMKEFILDFATNIDQKCLLPDSKPIRNVADELVYGYLMPQIDKEIQKNKLILKHQTVVEETFPTITKENAKDDADEENEFRHIESLLNTIIDRI